MILTKLILHNFGLFANTHTFDLKPRSDDDTTKPLVLFGGKNGTGKTTILAAIRLCLYGREALEYRASTAEYHAYLKKMLHRSSGTIADTAMVALEFEHMQGGELVRFRAERTWESTDRGVSENLVLRRNDAIQFGLSPEYWQGFLKDLVPPGISDLFFFDGERIQNLADDAQGGPALTAAVKDLLGINLIEQLEADLKVTLSRLIQNGSNPLADARQEMDREDGRLGELCESLAQDKAGISAKQQQVDGRIQAKERELSERGGAFAENRLSARASADVLKERVNRLRQDLRDSCGELLPFALSPNLCGRLREQLRREQDMEYHQMRRSILRESASSLSARIHSEDLWRNAGSDIPAWLIELISNYVEQALVAEAGQEPDSIESTLVHGLSAQDRERAMLWIDESIKVTREQVLTLIEVLHGAQSDLEHLERVLEAAPPPELLMPIISDLQSLYKEKAELDSQYSQLDRAEKTAIRERVELQRKINQLEQERNQAHQKQGRVAQVLIILDVLSRFRRELLELRLTDLETVFSEYFNRLAQKRGLVSHVIIDRGDLSMTLVSREGRYIAKAQLSAGEKQIYAIAMLWALRAVAARPLPVIIDTPLGRLDSSHRRNLVDHYFPEASHQVIVLSTDTEIDAVYFADLAPFISHAYHLFYDDTKGGTNEIEGYFWQPASLKEVSGASQ